MSEVERLEIFDLEGKSIGEMPRAEYYRELAECVDSAQEITMQIKSIRALLMSSSGRVYLQKRSKAKEVNPGLYDKTVGGHVPIGHSWNQTLVRECAEELGFPASVFVSDEFDLMVKLVDLKVVGLFQQVDILNNYQSVQKTKDGRQFQQPWMTAIFIGYFDGAIRFADGESTGVEVFSLSELQDEMAKYPERFTEDLKVMIGKYGQYIKPISGS